MSKATKPIPHPHADLHSASASPCGASGLAVLALAITAPSPNAELLDLVKILNQRSVRIEVIARGMHQVFHAPRPDAVIVCSKGLRITVSSMWQRRRHSSLGIRATQSGWRRSTRWSIAPCLGRGCRINPQLALFITNG
jgi:hypothetical protein